jgi:hypothetical protein
MAGLIYINHRNNKKTGRCTMNKSDFIRELRQRIENKPAGALKKLFIDVARFIPRNAHADVLLLFERDNETTTHSEDTDLLSAVKQLIDGVESGEYELSWEIDGGEYYGGYWSDDEMLEDHDGFGPKVNDLLEASVQCVKQKQYAKALRAFDDLFSIVIPGGDYDDMDIMTLFDNDLLSLNETEVLLYYAYAAIMVLLNQARVEKLFEIVTYASYKMKLEAIKRQGQRTDLTSAPL